MVHRNSIMIYAFVCACVLAHATAASADHPRPVERLGRWSGYGWGDGYHACESSGLRLAADLPPSAFASRLGHGKNKCGHQGCSGCGKTFYDRFDAANAATCDHASCDGFDCDGSCDFQATHGDSLLSATDEDFAPLPKPSELNDSPDSDSSRTSTLASKTIRVASTQQPQASPQTEVFPLTVQRSGTPDEPNFRLLDRGPMATLVGNPGQMRTPQVPPTATFRSVMMVAVRRPSRLPSVNRRPQPLVPSTVGLSSETSDRPIPTDDWGQPPIKLNPFAR